MSRLVAPNGIAEIVALEQPFSNFSYAEEHFQGSFPIRRLFSQARGRKCKTLVIEDVPPAAAVEDENTEIRELFPDYQMAGLKRLSFWLTKFSDSDALSTISASECIGYALLKHDVCPIRKLDLWHVFESAIAKYDHPHNYTPCAKPISFRVGQREFSVSAVFYCQQNRLNKACAQVALRSICATYLSDFDLSFKRINDFAFVQPEARTPWVGLQINQIVRVLDGLGIPFDETYYDPNKRGRKTFRESFPYQRILYSGVESGMGGLLAFMMRGRGATNVGHMIPLFGHTFNEDAWAPHAHVEYFNVGEEIRFIPSDAWLSSFIVHDDNFGSNLCIPKAYLPKEAVRYVIALLPPGFVYPGLYAELSAADCFYSMIPKIPNPTNPWITRLLGYYEDKRLILRHVPITKDGYLTHLSTMSDWDGGSENSEILRHLRETNFADKMWMIELSVPDLFSTNKRKIGELLFAADKFYTNKTDFTLFVLARFPGIYMFFNEFNAQGVPEFVMNESWIKSHTPLFGTR